MIRRPQEQHHNPIWNWSCCQRAAPRATGGHGHAGRRRRPAGHRRGGPGAGRGSCPAAPPPPIPALHLTGNIGIVSQYVFRGTTQTNQKPALQGGFDLTHDNGLYAGVWLSNISWISDTNPAASASLEADIYGGWKPA
jgi:hypothetical protein